MKVTENMTYAIELNAKEAQWLRGIMQNPLFGQQPEEEDDIDRKMRELFFDAVKGSYQTRGFDITT